jgi:N-acetylmuramic acid 6-phosphate etherase
MIDLMAVNDKLIDRGTRIIVQLTGVDYQLANSKLLDADKSVKTAIVMIRYSCSKEEAIFKLNKSKGFLRKLL